ncbi:MAG: glycosyltransferase family 4 protein [Labilithrix sp.]|nr:glycosyltransferase family 4 protein [Labilithrix sp.]
MHREPHRLLLLTQHFPPSSEIAGKVTARLLRYLGRFGWETTVMTVPAEQAGAPLDTRGYADVYDRVRVERVARWPYPIDGLRLATRTLKQLRGLRPAPAANGAHTSAAPSPLADAFSWAAPQSAGALARIARYLSFPDSRSGWIAPATARARRLLARERYDALLTVGPSHSTHLVALLLHRLAVTPPWIAHLHDPWADFEDREERSRNIRRAQLFFERRILEQADEVLFATREARDGYAARFPGVRRDKLGVLVNGYDPADFPSADSPSTGSPSAERDARPLTFVHVGTIYGGRDPRPFLEGLAQLVTSKALDPRDVEVHFLGGCDSREAVERAVADAGLAGAVTLHGVVDHEEAIRRMLTADVLVLLAQEQDYQIPAKLYEYLSAGRFVLAFTGGASATVIEDAGAGRVVGPRDDVAAALADVLARHRDGRLAGHHVSRARLRRYQADHLAGELAARMDRLVEAHHASR